VATSLGIFLIPALYVLVEKYIVRGKSGPPPASPGAPSAAPQKGEH